MESDSESIDTSELEHTFLITNAAIEDMLGTLNQLESRLEAFHRPLQDLTIDQFGNLDYLMASPFRSNTFRFSKPEIAKLAGLDPKQRHTYSSICEKLRNALLATNSVDSSGHIQMNKQLQTLFETNATTVTFLALLGSLRTILV